MSTKPFEVSKLAVWSAWKRIKANGGGAGSDGITIEKYESNLGNNLYKLWNRLCSGSYFPMPVKRVEIPKPDGSMRPLGIPTLEDRVAQMVVKQQLEAKLESIFHPDSYGYRPDKSAIDAVSKARQRCWERMWVVDLDIKGFFDNIDHTLLLRALDKHNDHRWVTLYIKRWLTASVQHKDGTLEQRTKGTPQGGVISPLLANLFLHYVLDAWMGRKYPDIPFERYADDAVYHCKTSSEAEEVLIAIKRRLQDCSLEAHPEKTRQIYCKDSNRRHTYPDTYFDFLGYRFKPRRARNKKGQVFTSFSPSMSPKAMKRIKDNLRQRCIIHWSNKTPEDLADALNPVIRGWLNYYGHFGKAEGVYLLSSYLDQILMRWARRKYKRLARSYRKSWAYISKLKKYSCNLFVHWDMKMC